MKRNKMGSLLKTLLHDLPWIFLLVTIFMPCCSLASKPQIMPTADIVKKHRHNDSLLQRNSANITSTTRTLYDRKSAAENNTLNTQDKEELDKCKKVICHTYTYLHHMYSFYVAFGGYFMTAVVVFGVAFLVITHFHGRYIVKTKQHVVGRIQIWDVIQHRKQQLRERNLNWI